jgi:hypothetical protein
MLEGGDLKKWEMRKEIFYLNMPIGRGFWVVTDKTNLPLHKDKVVAMVMVVTFVAWRVVVMEQAVTFVVQKVLMEKGKPGSVSGFL